MHPGPGHSPHLSGGRTGRTRSATPPSGPRPSRHAPAPPVGQPDPATPSGATRASDPSTILLPGEAKLDPAKLLLYALAARAFGIPASTALPQAAKFSDLSEPCRHTDAAGGLPRSAPPAQQPTVRIIFKQLVRLVHPTQHPLLQRRRPPLAFCRNGNPTGGGPLILCAAGLRKNGLWLWPAPASEHTHQGELQAASWWQAS